MSWASVDCAAALWIAPCVLALAIGVPMPGKPFWGRLLRASLLALCFGYFFLTVEHWLNVTSSYDLFVV